MNETTAHSASDVARGILLHWFERNRGVKRARQRPCDTHLQPKFGEWLSLVEHLVRDQGVGGSNPLSPTILSRTIKKTYAAFLAESLSSIFGTFGTIEGKLKPIPYSSAFFLRNPASSLTRSYRSSIESPVCPNQ